MDAPEPKNRQTLDRRVPVNTTVSNETVEWFNRNPVYTLGRALDDWVKDRQKEELADQLRELTRKVEEIGVGACGCGRVIQPPNRANPKAHCPGCQEPAKDCACQETIEKRRRRYAEWELLCAHAGQPILPDDRAAKLAELDLLPSPPKPRGSQAVDPAYKPDDWHLGPRVVKKK